jgi:hypothetical protein
VRFDDTGDGIDEAGTVVTDDGENEGCHGATLLTCDQEGATMNDEHGVSPLAPGALAGATAAWLATPAHADRQFGAP